MFTVHWLRAGRLPQKFWRDGRLKLRPFLYFRHREVEGANNESLSRTD